MFWTYELIICEDLHHVTNVDDQAPGDRLHIYVLIIMEHLEAAKIVLEENG